MTQKNILKEVSEIIKSTNDNINFVISKRSTNCVELLNSIHTILANVEQLLKREGEAQAQERTELLKAYNLEKSCKNQAYFFILEKGHLDEYQQYCAENPVKKF